MTNRIVANEEIYGYNVIVIDDTGTNKGELNKGTAIYQARQKGYDLVQVGKSDRGIPICKFSDLGKLKFELSKNSKNHSKPVETKEMMFHLGTGANDILVKKNKIRNMIEKKCIVRFGIELKGRERAFLDAAKEMLKNTVEDLKDVAKWDDMKVSENIVFVVLRPSKEHSNGQPE